LSEESRKKALYCVFRNSKTLAASRHMPWALNTSTSTCSQRTHAVGSKYINKHLQPGLCPRPCFPDPVGGCLAAKGQKAEKPRKQGTARKKGSRGKTPPTLIPS